MGWNSKVSKDDLKEAGLDVDQLTSGVGKVADLEAKLTTMQSENKTLVDTVTALKGTLDSLATRLTTPPVTKKEGEEGNVSSGNNEEEELDFLTNPQEAIGRVVAKQMAPLVNITLQSKADANFKDFKATNPRGWAKIEDKINKMWDAEPLSNRANPRLIGNIYKIVAMENFDLIKDEPTTFTVEKGGGGNTHTDVKRKASEVLSNDEKDVARKMGISDEDYLAEKEGRVIYG